MVALVNPDILAVAKHDDNGNFLRGFTVPFDPHDQKYWRYVPGWLEQYDKSINSTLGEGVRLEVITKDDIVFDYRGGESVQTVKCHFFVTHKHYKCRYFYYD
jgi:hypothetical protein